MPKNFALTLAGLLTAAVASFAACSSSSKVRVDAGGDAVLLDAGGDAAVGVPDAADSSAFETSPAPTPLKLTISTQGGFDDFSSPGAALGYAVDEAQGMILIVALKFNLPLAAKDFSISPDLAATLLAYTVKPDAELLQDDVAAWPLLQAGITDTIGIRTMDSDATVILLEGDLQSEVADRIFVANSGDLALFRNDGPSDTIEGSATLVEVTELGAEGLAMTGGEELALSPFYFEF